MAPRFWVGYLIEYFEISQLHRLVTLTDWTVLAWNPCSRTPKIVGKHVRQPKTTRFALTNRSTPIQTQHQIYPAPNEHWLKHLLLWLRLTIRSALYGGEDVSRTDSEFQCAHTDRVKCLGSTDRPDRPDRTDRCGQASRATRATNPKLDETENVCALRAFRNQKTSTIVSVYARARGYLNNRGWIGVRARVSECVYRVRARLLGIFVYRYRICINCGCGRCAHQALWHLSHYQ